MAFADKLSFARKQKNIRQADLGKLVGTSGDIIGKYERGENTPSIEVAAKISDALEVSLDYLVKDGDLKALDKQTLKRLGDIDNLSDKDKEYIFYTLDNLIKAAKLNAL